MKTKNTKTTVMISAVLICTISTIAISLNSCDKDPMTPMSNGTKKTKQLTDDACATSCFEIGGPYYEKADFQGTIIGNWRRGTDIIYYNTETDFVIKIKSSTGWSNLMIDGRDAWNQGPVAAGTWGVYTEPLDKNWQACDKIEKKLAVIGRGAMATFKLEYDLFGLCKGCVDKFSGEAVSCDGEREVFYTFIAQRDMRNITFMGGLIDYMMEDEDAVVTVDGGDFQIAQAQEPHSTNRMIKIQGNVDACQMVTIKVKWNSRVAGGAVTTPWTVMDADGNEIAPPVHKLTCFLVD